MLLATTVQKCRQKTSTKLKFKLQAAQHVQRQLRLHVQLLQACLCATDSISRLCLTCAMFVRSVPFKQSCCHRSLSNFCQAWFHLVGGQDDLQLLCARLAIQNYITVCSCMVTTVSLQSPQPCSEPCGHCVLYGLAAYGAQSSSCHDLL